MLIKTEQFDKALSYHLRQLAINTQKPVDMKGSYKIKPYGSYITDIDLSQYVMANDGLLRRLVQIIERLRDFVFLRLHCGTYELFEIPWEIDNEGGCFYDPKMGQEWYKNIEKSGLVDQVTLSTIRDLVFSDKMTIADLPKIRQITRPYGEILWDKEDIRRGYKEFQGKKVFLLHEMKKGHTTVVRYLYRYRGDYVMVDFSLVDRKYLLFPSMFQSYYTQNWYKIFKSYKWYLKREYMSEFVEVLKVLEKYTALLNRIKIASMLRKYKIGSKEDLSSVENDCKIWMTELGAKNEEDIEKRIAEISKERAMYFRPKVQEKFRELVLKYHLRMEESLQPRTQKQLETAYKKGRLCPFFSIQKEDFSYLVKLAERILFDPKTMLDCFSDAVEKLDVDPFFLLNTVFKKNTLYLRKENGKILVQDGNAVRKEFTNLKEAQRFVLLG